MQLNLQLLSSLLSAFLLIGNIGSNSKVALGVELRQTFLDYSSSSSYDGTGSDFLDEEQHGEGYETVGGGQGYQDPEEEEDTGEGSERQGYAPIASYEPRSERNEYEPVHQSKKSRSSRGHGGGYNDEDDDDHDDGYGKKRKKKKKIKPKVIIVKKIIPLSTTTAVNPG